MEDVTRGPSYINRPNGGVFAGYKDLSTPFLEQLKGRSTVPKQYLEDLSRQGGIKGPEREAIRAGLSDEGETVNVPSFAEKMKSELLPLKVKRDKLRGAPLMTQQGRYENIVLPNELRGPVASYSERIYESPIKTSAGDVHFREEDNSNYFAHSRIEDLPTSEAEINTSSGGRFNNLGSEKGQYVKEPTRRILEIQSDLFQKGRLDNERITAGDKKVGMYDKDYDPALEKTRLEELSKLEPYRNTWHERIIREEVKQAAKDGKTKLQFPTGETAMKIEGLGDNTHFFNLNPKTGFSTTKLIPEELSVGKEIGAAQGRENWIVTDVLGDGKFKAMDKHTYEQFKQAEKEGMGDRYAQAAETFDISGKINTENPIYRFYEKTVGKYLEKNYDAKRVTDAQGVEWWEVPIEKADAKLPVGAFSAIPRKLAK